MAVPRWATRVGSVRCAGARAGACLARRVGRRVRPCAGEGPGAVARGNHAPRTGRPRTLWVPPRLGWGVWSGFVGPPPRRALVGPRLDSGARRAPPHTAEKQCVFFPRRALSAPSQLPSTAAPVAPLGRSVRGEGFGSTPQSGRLPTKKQNMRRVDRQRTRCCPCAPVLGSCRRAVPVDCQLHCPPATFCQLSDGGRPLPHIDQKRARASQCQPSRVTETAVGSCLCL